MKLNVVKRVEGIEHQLSVCKVLGLAGLTVESVLKNKTTQGTWKDENPFKYFKIK